MTKNLRNESLQEITVEEGRTVPFDAADRYGRKLVVVQGSSLPSGAATEAKQDDIIDELQAIGIPSSISEGSVSVATPGTAVVLGSSLATKEIILSALDTNTAPVTVGGSGVLTSTGMRIFPGAMATIKIDNRNKVYVNSSAVATVQYTAFS